MQPVVYPTIYVTGRPEGSVCTATLDTMGHYTLKHCWTPGVAPTANPSGELVFRAGRVGRPWAG